MPLKLNPADGVRFAQFKEQSFSRPLFRLRSPETVTVPLFAFGAGSMLPIPRVGESVSKNSMLARTRNSQSWVVCPVSGKLLRIERRDHPMMGSVLCAVIAVRDSLPALDVKGHNPHSMTPMGIVQAARMACIIDEVDGLPLYYKLMKGMKEDAQLIVADALDDTPYISSALKTVSEFGDEALDGVGMALKALDGGKALLAVYDCGEIRLDTVVGNFGFTDVCLVGGGYPAWSRFEEERLRGRKVLRIGVQALRALSLAVRDGLPQTETVITVCGDCVETAANIVVPTGVTVEYILREAGLRRVPEYIILGDTMRGVTCSSTDIPVMPGIRGICAMSSLDLPEKAQNCISCGRCVEVCPRQIFVSEIVRLYERGTRKQAIRQGISRCDGCGACSAVCPSGIEISAIMDELAEMEYAERKQQSEQS